MLEVLTGRRAIFRARGMSVVDYAAPSIDTGELGKVLDPVAGATGAPGGQGFRGSGVHHGALHQLGGERRPPAMLNVVMNLESTLALCEASNCPVSSDCFTLVSFD
ncbi:hypothetical protein IEQ34_006251 [Dendrobium chrysotoxum]|uniref:Uncharacterized protein n=1 Tax=Dendrobium chrysotoxum TaxID=161865 RepID=A0AAV7HEX0_DENCH|nr:hypothetical protein IEQ34_006251 [Dendrobium chrysotoxum]